MTTARYIGQVIADKYRIASVLGEGGMGAVFAADRMGGGRVAIKMLLPQLADSEEMRRRFEREANAVSFLEHPNVVDSYELGHLDNGSMYLAMELVQGDTVAELIARGPIHPRKALVIARQALSGLGYVHQHGLIHRDLKPDNLMLARVESNGQSYEVVKLLDFGVVKLLAHAAKFFGEDKLTQTGVAFGTPSYMAPEQALGRPLDGRADLYSMGVILWEMLTSQPPFESDKPLEILRMHIGTPLPCLRSVTGDASWCTAEVEALVVGALRKRPDERFVDAHAMLRAVDAAFVSIDHIPNAAD